VCVYVFLNSAGLLYFELQFVSPAPGSVYELYSGLALFSSTEE
jgi:hypothetical protein